MKLRITIIDNKGKTNQKIVSLNGAKIENDFIVGKLQKSFRKLQVKGSISGFNLEYVP